MPTIPGAVTAPELARSMPTTGDVQWIALICVKSLAGRILHFIVYR
jgi:hypothetical protein